MAKKKKHVFPQELYVRAEEDLDDKYYFTADETGEAVEDGEVFALYTLVGLVKKTIVSTIEPVD